MTDQKQLFIDEALEIAHDAGANSCVMGRLQAFMQERIGEPSHWLSTRKVETPLTNAAEVSLEKSTAKILLTDYAIPLYRLDGGKK